MGWYWCIAGMALCVLLYIVRWKREGFRDEPAALIALFIAGTALLWPLTLLSMLIAVLVGRPVTQKRK